MNCLCNSRTLFYEVLASESTTRAGGWPLPQLAAVEVKFSNFCVSVKLVGGVTFQLIQVDEGLVADGAAVEPDVGRPLRDLFSVMDQLNRFET